MCRRIRCEQCQKPTFAGCGKHVDQVLRDVPLEARCQCRQEVGSRTNPSANTNTSANPSANTNTPASQPAAAPVVAVVSAPSSAPASPYSTPPIYACRPVSRRSAA
jgi:hypothetical protein